MKEKIKAVGLAVTIVVTIVMSLVLHINLLSKYGGFLLLPFLYLDLCISYHAYCLILWTILRWHTVGKTFVSLRMISKQSALKRH